MTSIFSRLENDTIRVINKDGQQASKEYKAVVGNTSIQTFDVSIEVSEGDIIERLLSNSRTEKYLVLETKYNEGFAGAIPAHYEFKVSKTTSLSKYDSQPVTNIYHMNGNNSRVMHNSTDYSSNVVNQGSDKLFEDLRLFISEQLADANLIPLVNEMEQTRGTRGFTAKYNAFIQAAANHMTVLSPFLPALSTLLIQGQA